VPLTVKICNEISEIIQITQTHAGFNPLHRLDFTQAAVRLNGKRGKNSFISEWCRYGCEKVSDSGSGAGVGGIAV
jgi:hypothetical protein